MTQVSRPVLIVLIVVVAFAGVWLVALRPKSDSGSGGGSSNTSSAPDAPGVKGLTKSIAKAKGAVKTSQDNAAKVGAADASTGGAAASGASSSSSSGSQSGSASGSSSSTASPQVRAVSAKASAATAKKVAAVDRGLHQRKVVALLFYNPRSSDDKMVRQEFSRLSTRGGRVVLVAAPLAALSSFGEVTQRVQVTEASSLIVFDHKGKASSIVGFTTDAEMSQRISDALATKA
ncbi:MAG: hypothetical protein U0T02_08270 [Solirubrobacteraceae bacterium]